MSALLQASGVRLVEVLHGLTRALVLYDANNAAVARQIRVLHDTLRAWFKQNEQPIRLQLLQEECFINGTLVRLEPALYARHCQLSERMRGLGVGELVFRSDVDETTLVAFAGDLVVALRGGDRPLAGAHFEGLELKAFDGRAVASLRVKPDRLAAWLYGSLLALLQRVYSAQEQGQHPSLGTLRRTLQLATDAAERGGAVFRLLAATEPQGSQTPKAVRATRLAVEVLCFGAYAGLPRLRRLALALALALEGLLEEDGGVEQLFLYPGLGGTAVDVVLSLQGARVQLRTPQRADVEMTEGLNEGELRQLGLVDKLLQPANAMTMKSVLTHEISLPWMRREEGEEDVQDDPSVVSAPPDWQELVDLPGAALLALILGCERAEREQPGRGARRLLLQLEHGDDPLRSELAMLYRAYLGDYQMGQVIELDGGMKLMVVGLPLAGALAPRVRQVKADGSVGPVQDLATFGTLNVRAVKDYLSARQA